jgi:Allene oxide cyclase barrel like domain
MRRKLATFGALTGLLAVGLMIVTLLPASSATTISVYDKSGRGFERQIDVDPQRGLAGDYIVGTHALYRAGTGKRVGRDTLQLLFIRALGKQDARFRAAATFKIDGGTIEAAGSRKFSKLDTGAKFAITGGTGAYAGASGTLVVRETPHRTHFVFHIIP